MKKHKIFFIGALSLIIFGLLLPQPIQALLVLVESPIKEFFEIHTLLLCIIVGLIQGLSEEYGYYFVLKRILKNENSIKIPIIFGLGRSSLHTIFDIGTILFMQNNIFNLLIAILSRVIGFVALIGLTLIDYNSIIKKKKSYLILSVLLHAIMNGTLYAAELNFIKVNNNFDSFFMICFSCTVIIISMLICREDLNNDIVNR